MIDTIHLSVPISWNQYRDAAEVSMARGQNVGVLFKTATHEVWIRRVSDVATLDRGSFERDVFWSVPGGTIEHVPRPDGLFERRWVAPSGPYCLEIQASLPKVFYGHNISLLHDWPKALELLKDGFKRWFGWRSLPDVKTWKVNRCDFCYAWRMPDAATAMEVTELMKRLRYPHKKPRHYPGTAMWPATANGGYAVKMYAKGPEFEKHDRPKLEKQATDSSWVDNLAERAKRVVRFEITGKAKFLRRHHIHTVEDIMGYAVTYSVTPELWEWIGSVRDVASGKLPRPVDPSKVISMILAIAAAEGHIPLNADLSYALDDGQAVTIPELVGPPDGSGLSMRIPAGTIEIKLQAKTEYLLQIYLQKMVGTGDMSMSDEVKETLQRHYKGAKAGRLYSTWLTIQREGATEAMNLLGLDAYYRDVRMIRSAGITIIEKHGVLIKPGNDFWNKFRIEIPSPFAVNSVDDFSDHENLINMMEWAERDRQAN